MRLVIFFILCFLYSNSYGFRVVKYTDKVVGYTYHIMDDSTFNVYKKYVTETISKKLSPRHTQLISEIVITDSYVHDTADNDGICNFVGDSIQIVISVKSDDLDGTIFHEVSHAMKYTFDGSAWAEIVKEWKKCNRYATEYAMTNIDEDFAETGAFYLTGRYNSRNTKYKLFKYFIDRI